MTEPIIETQALTKAFKRTLAVDHLDLAIPRGSVYGLLGRNGAGKTTTLRLLMGLLNPTSGKAHINGKNMHTAAAADRQRVAYISQTQRLYRGLSGEEHLRMIAPLYNRWNSRHAETVAKRFEVDLTKPAGALSGGQRRMLAVTLALASQPDVLILDEPAAGLDPLSRRRLIEALADILGDDESRTVLLSTHLVEDLERLATEVGFMDQGKIVLSRPTDELREQMRRVQVIARDGALPPDIAIPGAIQSKTEGVVMTALAALPAPDALEPLKQHDNLTVQSFPMTLEEIFIALFDANQEKNDDK